MSYARTAGGFGIIAFVLMVLNVAFYGSTPTLDDPTSEIVAYIGEDLDMHRLALIFGVLILPFYAVFLSGMVARIYAVDREHGEAWGLVALIGGIMIGATATIGGVAVGTLLLRGGAGMDDETIRAIWDLGGRAYSGVGIAIAVLTGAVAMSSYRHPRWPPWYTYLSALVALIGVISVASTSWTSDTALVLGYVAFTGLAVWTLVSSIMLVNEE